MAYKISARHPGRAVTYTADTEEAALAKWDELIADGVPFEMTDADGVVVDDLDLEERIDAKGDSEPPPAV
jgi:ketosteroid isomerase-like protein